ncbi:putative P-loop containing nucleoside triphosphate hydrolase, leucine-rich repeat domain superfamily [Helianthus debilis subsp. tardiflorus]
MAVATDRLLMRLQRLRVKADGLLTTDVTVGYDYEHAPLSFKILCKKAMSVCIIDPLWRIVHLSAPELIRFLHEEDEEYTSLDAYWLKSLPKILHELQTVLISLDDSRNWGILDRHMWDQVNKDEQVKGMLDEIKHRLAAYFPVLIDEAPRINDVLEELKMVIDVMLILCCEFMDSNEEIFVFDDVSRRLLKCGFTQRQLELLSLAGRLPMKQNVDEKETVVGFEEDTIKLLERLTGFSKKLEVIPIVGMAGLGKTTLAKRLYRDPYVVYFFDIRAWSYVSQEYVKRDLLLGILSSIVEFTNRINSMSDEQLGEQIYRGLKGRKYLVVLDDIWDNRAWKELKIYFPDDRNGSRIVLTSRNIDLNLEATTHRLRLRTARESWRLLQTMVFENGKCPWRLYDVGKQISAKCYGLPLAISITAGLLRSRWTRAYWKEVAESSRVFPGDCDIPVHKLIRLWVAQGFIDQSASKSLEDVAEDYLMDLLGRSLVMVSKKGDDGQIKACHVHDLLRSLCVWKAKEEAFSPIEYRYGRVSSAISPVPAAEIENNMPPGMSSEHSTQHVNFVLCCPIELGECFQMGLPVEPDTYKFLRILDIESIFISLFPTDILNLVNLRYLAIKSEDGNPPTPISNLIRLQILIISSTNNIVLPTTTWDIKCLRHLYIKSGKTLIEDFSSEFIGILENLQTLSGVCPSPSCLSILTRTPNLRRLGFSGPLVSTSGVLEFPNIRSLDCLLTLKLSNTMKYHAPVKSCSPLMFPERLTRLTIRDLSGVERDSNIRVATEP